MTSNIRTEKKDDVLTLFFNRPDKKNALLAAMYADVAIALRSAAEDSGVRVVVITGSGDSFCAGNDLKNFLENPPMTPDAPVFQFMDSLAHCPKPVIAAVNGIAVGVGTTMLLHCDLVYAATTAKFQFPFVNIALVPEYASTFLLPRMLGNAHASELMLLGEVFNADRAEALGIVNDVVAPEALMLTVMEKAQALAEKPPAALRKTKALLRAGAGKISMQIAIENRALGESLESAEFKEAATAFLEKRAPNFRKFK